MEKLFQRFESNFLRDATSTGAAEASSPSSEQNSYLKAFWGLYSGATFNNGVYRVVNPKIAKRADEFVKVAFPDYSGRVTCFASDWLGRIFGLDFTRREAGEMAVIMFEPGTGEALEIPANLATFHDQELVDYPDEALATQAYKEWLAHDGRVPRFDQCVEYKTPLFLDGANEIENMRLSDLEVSWSISAQLIERVRRLPPGTKISRISLT